MIIKTKGLLPVLMVPSLVLLIPLIAMLFKVDGWHWGVADFIVIWVLIAGAILMYKLVARKSASGAYRAAAIIALIAVIALVWINGAVGLIGSEDNPANIIYFGVLAVAALGAVIAQLEPSGMARALTATALAQAVVPVIALIYWPSDFSPGVVQVFGLNFVFVLLFAAAGLLFRRAGRDDLAERRRDVARRV